MFFKPQENHKKTGNNFNPFYHNFHEKEISKSGEKLTEKKGNFACGPRGNAVSKLFQINFHCEASSFVIFQV